MDRKIESGSCRTADLYKAPRQLLNLDAPKVDLDELHTPTHLSRGHLVGFFVLCFFTFAID